MQIQKSQICIKKEPSFNLLTINYSYREESVYLQPDTTLKNEVSFVKTAQ